MLKGNLFKEIFSKHNYKIYRRPTKSVPIYEYTDCEADNFIIREKVIGVDLLEDRSPLIDDVRTLLCSQCENWQPVEDWLWIQFQNKTFEFNCDRCFGIAEEGA